MFGATGWNTAEELEQLLSAEEMDMLMYYLTSGVYGTEGRRIENTVQELKKEKKRFPKLAYVWKRLFPGASVYKIYFPPAQKHLWLLPIGWLKRTFSVIFGKKGTRIINEIKKVQKV